MNSVTSSLRELEKKQKRFDQQISEERANMEKIKIERDSYAQESRDRETKILSLNNDLGELRDRLDKLEDIKKTLQEELDDVVSSKDDAGKNLHELERAKRQMEEEVRDLKTQVEELDDALTVSEDARLRMDVTMQAMRKEHERALSTKTDEEDESRRSLLNRIRDLETEIENERRTKVCLLLSL